MAIAMSRWQSLYMAKVTIYLLGIDLSLQSDIFEQKSAFYHLLRVPLILTLLHFPVLRSSLKRVG